MTPETGRSMTEKKLCTNLNKMLRLLPHQSEHFEIFDSIPLESHHADHWPSADNCVRGTKIPIKSK